MIRLISWPAVLFQLLLVVLLGVGLSSVAGVREPPFVFFLGALAHAVLYRFTRITLVSNHRRGIKLFRAGRFSEAAPSFEASHADLSRRPWIDRFRWLTLGSASSMSYLEMAICNAAFCYSQIGNGLRALALYERAHRQFPENSLAIASLNMLRSVQSPGSTTGKTQEF